MLTKAQMQYATARLAEIPETDREPVLDVLRDELPRDGQVSDDEFRRALQSALDRETSGKCDEHGAIPKLRPGLPMNEVAEICRRLSHSSPAPLPPERQARLDEREKLLRAEFDKLAPEERLGWQRSVFSKDATELSTNPIVRIGTYIAWKTFKETGRSPGVERKWPQA